VGHPLPSELEILPIIVRVPETIVRHRTEEANKKDPCSATNDVFEKAVFAKQGKGIDHSEGWNGLKDAVKKRPDPVFLMKIETFDKWMWRSD
jgi:hypothetical protein